MDCFSFELKQSMDKKTGKNCFIVGARKLSISDNYHYNSMMQIVNDTKSRLFEVGLVESYSRFHIRGSIEIQKLSPDTIYGAYLVFNIKETSMLLDHLTKDDRRTLDVLLLEFIFHLSSNLFTYPDTFKTRSRHYHVVSSRPDSWKEIELGSFHIPKDADVMESTLVEVVLRVSPIRNWNIQLIIEGFEFRPWEACTQPFDWATLLKPIDTESLSFSIDEKTGKSCFMVGASQLLQWSTSQMIYHSKSRFSNVRLIEDKSLLKLEGSIEVQQLSPKTFYGAYLVYSFKAYTQNKDDDTLLSSKIRGSSTSIIRFLVENGQEPPQLKHVQKLQAVCRPDGWNEEAMGSFYIDGGQTGVVAVLFRWSLNSYYDLNTDLIVEGFEFRPVEERIDTDLFCVDQNSI